MSQSSEDPRLEVNNNLIAKPTLPARRRYFNKAATQVIDLTQTEDGGTLGKTKPEKEKKQGIKRKAPSDEAMDFISLNEPSAKQTRYDEPSSSLSVDNTLFGSIPFTVKEARRLFMSDPVSNQIHNFFIKHRQTENFLKTKEQLRSALENTINRTMLKNSHLLLVGSSVNGFGRVKSDADFCLVVDKHQERMENRHRVMETLRSLRKLLTQAPFTRMMQVIPAKVPILKFVDSYSGMECDINVNNLTGIRNTELMKRYAMLDPRVQPLALVIKEWAHQRDINNASQGTLSSYSLILMVIHFLQHGVHPPVLPSLQSEYPDLFGNSTPVMEIQRRARKCKAHRSRNMMTLIQLLRKFFEYFAEKFDFRKRVISVRLGTTLPINEVASYRDKEWSKPIKIEEPFDRTNTARAVHCETAGNIVFKQFRNANFILSRRGSLNALLSGVASLKHDPVITLDE